MRVISLIVCLFGCLRTNTVVCGDRVCPEGTTCDEVHALCVSAEQTTACEGKRDGDRCEAGPLAGICDQSYCIPGCGDGVHAKQEECDDGNFLNHDGCSSACLLESLSWQQVPDPWIPIAGLALAHIGGSHDKLVRFGGFDKVGSRDHQWERRGRLWQEVTASRPPARHFLAYAYDTTRNVLVVFGGTGTSLQNDETWEYDGASWQHIQTASRPPERTSAAMAFDANRGRMVLFGGYTYATGQYLDDTWEYDGLAKTWTQVTSTSKPSARMWHSMAWDAAAQRIVLFGGLGAQSFSADMTWRYDGTNRWVQIATTGPSLRYGAALAFLPARNRIVMFGGSTGAPANDTWELDTANGAWTQRALVTVPPPRYWHAMAYDADRNKIVIVGGSTGEQLYDDLWEYGGTWSEHTPAGAPPHATGSVAIAYDSRRQRTLGLSMELENDWTTDLWQFDGRAWTVVPSGSRPARAQYAIAYDEVGDRTVVFGGYDFANGGVLTSATWVWNGTSWSDVGGGGAPSPRADGGLAQLGPAGGVLLHGGLLAGATSTNETWELVGQTWRQVATPQEISSTILPAMIYDPVHERVVLFDQSGTTWVYQSGAWSRLDTIGSPPPRGTAAMAYRRDRGTVVLYGGSGFVDVWELDDATWTQLQVVGEQPLARLFTSMSYHASRRALLLYGGAQHGGLLDDTWLLRYGSLTPDEVCDNEMDDDDDQLTDNDDPDCAF